MNEDFQLFLKLSKVLKSLFNQAIKKAKTDIHNIDILGELSQSEEFVGELTPYANVSFDYDKKVKMWNIFKSIADDEGLQQKNEYSYSRLLLRALETETDIDKIRKLLVLHKQNIDLIKEFADTRLSELIAVDHRKLPKIWFDLKNVGRFWFGKGNTVAPKVSDYNELARMASSFDYLHQKLIDTYHGHESKQIIIDNVEVLTFVDVNPSDINTIENLQEQYSELDIEKTFTIFKNTCTEELFHQNYSPKETVYYDTTKTKPVYSKTVLQQKYTNHYIYKVYASGLRGIVDDVGHVFKILKNYNNANILWNEITDKSAPHIYYLNKIKQHNRSLTLAAKILSKYGVSKNSISRFLDQDSLSHLYNVDGLAIFRNNDPFFTTNFNKHIAYVDRISKKLDAFKRKIWESSQYYYKRSEALHNLFVVKDKVLSIGSSNKYTYRNTFTKAYIQKLTASLARNYYYCRDFVTRHGVFKDNKEIFRQIADFVDPRYIEDDQLVEYILLQENKSHHVSDQTKFDYAYLYKALDWFNQIYSDEFDLKNHIRKNIKIERQVTAPDVEVKPEEIDNEINAFKIYYHQQIDAAKKDLANPKTMLNDDGIFIPRSDREHYLSNIERLVNIAKEKYSSIVEKIGKAYGFDPKPYIKDLYNNNEYSKDTSDLNDLQKQALTVLKNISPPFDFEYEHAVQAYQAYMRSGVFGAYVDMLSDIDENLTDGIITTMSKSYKKDPKKHKKSIYDIVIDASDDGTQNSIQDVTGDTTKPIEYDLFKKAAVTPEERLKRYNKKIWKQVQQNSKNKLNDLLNRKGFSNIPKQNFIYKPYEKRTADDIFCEVLEEKVLLKQYKVSPLSTYEIPNILQTAKAQGRVIQLFVPIEQVNRAGFSVIGRDGSARIVCGGSGGEYQPRGLLKSGPGANEKSFMNKLRQLRNLVRPSGNGHVIKGPGFIEAAAARGTVVQGPGAMPTMPMGGRIAGGYIGMFIVLPRVCDDVVTIASPKTEMVEKGSAALDLSAMVGTMWLFTKFVATKYPKTAAAIMVGTAGKHAWDTTTEFYDSLGQGKTKSTIIFMNEEAMLKAGMSCFDGRRPEYLNPHANRLYKSIQLKR